jgi:hypothetical protein
MGVKIFVLLLRSSKSFSASNPGLHPGSSKLSPYRGQIRRIITIMTLGETGGGMILIDQSPRWLTLLNLKKALFYFI